MRNFILLILIVLFPTMSHAVVTEISTAGTNLGISTTSTANTLSVLGGLAVGSATTTSATAPTNGAMIQGNVAIGTVTANALLNINSSANQTLFRVDDTAGTDPTPFIIDQNGNVGVGTITPSTQLEQSASDSGTTITSASAAMHGIINSNTTNNNFADNAFGQVNASGAVVYTSKIAEIQTSHTAGSESGAIAFLTDNAGTVSEKMRVDSTGNIGIGNDTTPDASLEIIKTGSIPPLAVSSTNVSAAGDLLMINSSGNVGVGTNVPLSRLQVNADYANGGSDDLAQLLVGGSTNPNLRLQLGYDTTANYGFIRAVQAGTSTKAIILQPGGGNVGIGTTLPVTRLNVATSGTSNAISNVQSGGLITTQGSGGTLGLTLGHDSVVNRPFIQSSTGSIAFSLAINPFGGNVGIGTDIMDNAGLSIMNGNVGIGTWKPTQLLQVNGTMAFTGGGVGNLKISDGGGGTATIDNSSNANLNISSNTITNFTAGNVGVGYASGTGKLIVNGNVGIGTFVGTSPLQINGTPDTSAGGIVIVAQSNTGGSGFRIWNNAGAQGRIDAGSSGTVGMVLNSGGGNVGIGTITPGANLDVAGSIRSVLGASNGVGACWCTTPPKY